MRLQDLPTNTEPDEDLTKERARQQLIALAEYRATLEGDEVAYFDYEVRENIVKLALAADIKLTINKGKPRPELEYVVVEVDEV